MRLFKRFITGALRTFVEYCGCGDFQLLLQLAGLGFTNHPHPPDFGSDTEKNKTKESVLGFYEGRGFALTMLLWFEGGGGGLWYSKNPYGSTRVY